MSELLFTDDHQGQLPFTFYRSRNMEVRVGEVCFHTLKSHPCNDKNEF
jgi:hypothetical protein